MLRIKTSSDRNVRGTSTLPDRHGPRYNKAKSFTATEAKNEFGRLLDKAMQGETVVITKHDTPKAVLISIEQFTLLKQAPELALDSLSAEFDDLLARMQGSKASAAMRAAFGASPQRLGKAAVQHAKRG